MNNRHSLFSVNFGSFLEYYDFVIYGMLATYLKPVFFPPNANYIATVQLFLIFAVGYVARPIGGLLAGILGDRYGRKPIFLFLTLCMSMSTLLVGLLPTYSQIGSAATYLLIFCRLCQGLSLGGELPGATTLAGEYAPYQKRAFRVSFVIASTSMGALAASLMLFCLTHFLENHQIVNWGWRIPFIIGGSLGMLLFFIRKNMPESPLFQAQKQHAKLSHLLKRQLNMHRTHVVAGLMLTIFWSAMVIINLFFPYYLHQYYYFPEKSIYLAITISLAFSVFFLPLCGWLIDKVTPFIVLKWATLGYIVLSAFLFHILTYQNDFLLILFMIVHQVFIALFCACYTPFMMTLFPTKIRYTGMAICYNVSFAMISIAPTVLTTFLNHYPNIMLVPILLSGAALVSLIASIWIKHLNSLGAHEHGLQLSP